MHDNCITGVNTRQQLESLESLATVRMEDTVCRLKALAIPY